MRHGLTITVNNVAFNAPKRHGQMPPGLLSLDRLPPRQLISTISSAIDDSKMSDGRHEGYQGKGLRSLTQEKRARSP